MEFLMEFGLRDWLLVLGPVFIVGVLLHGYWRMRSSRGDLKMALDKSFLNSRHESRMDMDDLELFRAELPNGGARVISQPKQEALDLDGEIPVRVTPVTGAVQQTANFKAKTSITERMPARRKTEKIEPTIGIEPDLEPELKPKDSVDAETLAQTAIKTKRLVISLPNYFQRLKSHKGESIIQANFARWTISSYLQKPRVPLENVLPVLFPHR